MSNRPSGAILVVGDRLSGKGAISRWLSSHYALALFVAVFVIPTLLAILYFGLIASDRYVSETRFVVRSVSKPAGGGVSAYLQDFGIKSSNDDAYAVQEYIRSRDVMSAIMRKIDLRKVWQRDDADFLSRYIVFWGPDNNEDLFEYYLKQVKVERDLETGITTVRVKSFAAADSQALARLILQLGEAKVNEMNIRARQNRLGVAQREVANAADRLARATVALTRYRDTAQLVDPVKQTEAVTQQTTLLQGERARLQSELAAMQERAPNNPGVPALRRRLAAVDEQIGVLGGQLTGGAAALSTKLGGYEQLMVERELAAKVYEEAQKTLETAQEEARRQEVFVETVALPNLPDIPQEPQRIRYMFTVALLSFWTFLSLYLLVSGSREHLNLS